jgi:hypothetical protein
MSSPPFSPPHFQLPQLNQFCVNLLHTSTGPSFDGMAYSEQDLQDAVAFYRRKL